MKIALDPYMFRSTPLAEPPGMVADMGCEDIERSPREGFIPFFKRPRVGAAGIRAFKQALGGAGVQVSSLLPRFRWSPSGTAPSTSPPNLHNLTEIKRRTAARSHLG